MRLKSIFACVLVCLLVSVSANAQTAPNASAIPFLKPQWLSSSGLPLNAGKLYFYAAGSSTAQDTYTTSCSGVALPMCTTNTNPVVLDSGGRANVFLGPLCYKIVAQNFLGVQQWTEDNICDIAQLLSNATGAARIGYSPSPGNITTTVSAALNRIFSSPINAQEFSGADTFAKIMAAFGSSACAAGCNITDGLTLGTTETITSGALVFTGPKPVHLILHGIFTYAGAAISGGILRLNGGGYGTSGSRIECEGFPQNLGLEALGNALPCGIIYRPTSSTGPGIVLSENGGVLDDVQINNLSLVVNSNVTDPIQLAATGGGMGVIEFNNVSVAAYNTSQSWSGYGIALRCTNAGAPAGVQYVVNFHNVQMIGNGAGANAGLGGTTSSGILMDPTTGTVCGTFGPSAASNLIMEGLTGSSAFTAKGASSITIINPIINQNSFAANSDVIHLENGGNAPLGTIIGGRLDNNDWATNGGVTDVSVPSGAGLSIQGTSFNGGSAGTTHAEAQALKIGGSAYNVELTGNKIDNMGSFGTIVNAGAVGIKYCGNFFATSSGAATEFQSWPAIANHGCRIFSASTDNTFELLNMTAGVNWKFDSDDSGVMSLYMGSNVAFFLNLNRTMRFNRQIAGNIFDVTYGATSTPVLSASGGASSAGPIQRITVTDTSAFQVADPTGPDTGSIWVLEIVNSSGGVMAAPTWGASYRGLPGAFTKPANGKARFIWFFYDGALNWPMFVSQADL
jgi:hypothetical protein